MRDIPGVEVIAAANALEAWFISQSIPPGEAAVIMVHLMAREMLRLSKDKDRLRAGVKDMSTLLACEVLDEGRR